MKTGTNKEIIIITICLIVVVLIGWFIYDVSSTVKTMNEAQKKDSVGIVTSAPYDHLKLFQESNKLIFNQTLISRTRNPISEFTYDGKYRVIVCKLDTANNLSLDNNILETNKDQHMTYNLTYHLFDGFDKYEIGYKSGRQDKVSKIYLNLFGGQIKTIRKSNALAYYYLRFKNFNIKYNKSGNEDFFGSTKNDFGTVPIEIMLSKKGTDLYLILLAPSESNTPLEPGTLLSLMQM